MPLDCNAIFQIAIFFRNKAGCFSTYLPLVIILKFMSDGGDKYIEIDRLRIGHFVYLELGWLLHPFPINSFKISSGKQISAIRRMGLSRIRYSPELSDSEVRKSVSAEGEFFEGRVDEAQRATLESELLRRRHHLRQQRVGLQICERRFLNAVGAFKYIEKSASSAPEAVASSPESLVSGLLDDLNSSNSVYIRLLSDMPGERISLHSVNATVLSLLLGRACNFGDHAMRNLGVAAFLHDIGKAMLPARVRHMEECQSISESQSYRRHVANGVTMTNRMSIGPVASMIIGQHHEFVDGSGFPMGLKGNEILFESKILGLVNCYESLCNPVNLISALTPHEALAHIFSKFKRKFDEEVIHAFIRVIGVYPPGSLVQLIDNRYALVVSVNAVNPLKPQVVIYHKEVPPEQALAVDLNEFPDLRIARSLKPSELPRAVNDYLSPRLRICYFFDLRGGVDFI